MNASIYVWWKDILREKEPLSWKTAISILCQKERSVDIDDAIDFKIAEVLLKEAKEVE